MDSVRELAIIFCAVSVLTGAVGILTGGALKKSAGYILSLVFLASLVTALAGTNFNIQLETEQAMTDNAANEEAMSAYQAEYLAAALLTERELPFEKISASATKTEDGSIIINEMIIKGGNEASALAVVESGICDKVILE